MANIKDLSPNPRNPRKIEKKKLEMLAKSMIEFGSLDGFIYNIKSKQLVGGHQRQTIMPDDAKIIIEKRHDKKTPSGTVAEGHVLYNGERWPYREVEWNEDREKAANISANKGAGAFDLVKLQDFVIELDNKNFDLELTMFDDEELKDLFGKDFGRDTSKDATEDEVPALPKMPISKIGDLYELGEHRLLCGDSTDKSTVDQLMDGEKAEICFTSPPYNLGNNAKLRGYNGDGDDSAYNEKSDHKSESEYLDFLIKWTTLAIDNATCVFSNIQILAGNKFIMSDYWTHFKNNLVDLMVWDKVHAAPQMAARVLNSVWEFIFIFTGEQKPKRSIKTGPEFRGNVPNIFRMNPVGKKDPLAKNHGAVFPVEFAQYFIEQFSHKSVLDLFGGSGSTLIACEKTNRKCYMMELDPHYIDVIVSRWCKYTGKTNIKRNGEDIQWVNT